jgi:alkylation response protein AidB-like acyl-CoA dehydrogenase
MGRHPIRTRESLVSGILGGKEPEAMEFDWSAEDRAFREELRAFLAEMLPANWQEMTREGPGGAAQVAFSEGFCAEMARRGWLTQHWPAEFGGRDASAWRHAVVGEEMWGNGEPRGPRYMTVNWVGPAIMEFGTPEQKQLHLTKISRGESVWCQGFSEPEAGSDLAALRTQALRDGDDYVINGSKIWTSYVDHADYCFLVARTDPASRGRRGISVLLVPIDTPGIELREIKGLLGKKYFHEVFFTDCRVPTSCRLGPENDGWTVVTRALAYERVGAAHYQRAQWTLDATARRAGELGLLEDPAVLERLGAAQAVIDVARLHTYKVIDEREKQAPPGPQTNLARVAGTWAVRTVAELTFELFGYEGLGYGSFADSYFRLGMWAGTASGTTEVQLNLIASRHLGLPRE